MRDLWFRYRADLPWIFSGIDLSVETGTWHQLDGPSGFGKTTLLRLIAGLYQPTRGSIRVSGRSPQEAREELIYLPQFVLLAQGGGNFSDGQRQLIALTGVLAAGKPILLLDEAMANIDSLRRAALAQSPLLREHTIVWASHAG